MVLFMKRGVVFFYFILSVMFFVCNLMCFMSDLFSYHKGITVQQPFSLQHYHRIIIRNDI